MDCSSKKKRFDLEHLRIITFSKGIGSQETHENQIITLMPHLEASCLAWAPRVAPTSSRAWSTSATRGWRRGRPMPSCRAPFRRPTNGGGIKTWDKSLSILLLCVKNHRSWKTSWDHLDPKNRVTAISHPPVSSSRLLKTWFGPTAVTEGTVLKRRLEQDKRRAELEAEAKQMRGEWSKSWTKIGTVGRQTIRAISCDMVEHDVWICFILLGEKMIGWWR